MFSFKPVPFRYHLTISNAISSFQMCEPNGLWLILSLILGYSSNKRCSQFKKIYKRKEKFVEIDYSN